jgi:PhnB protein
MAKYTTYILSENTKGQAEFYTKVLGGEILSVMTYGQLPDANEALKDKVIHLNLIAGA